jgi:hypothetical protein
MPKVKAPHHRGTYHQRSRALVAAAYANLDTRCGRCGRRLHEHPPTRTGNPPRWSAGHINDGQINGPLRPEVLSCNSRAGAPLGNRSPKRKRTWRPGWPTRTDLTW